ncbi:morphogenic membrane protein MmpB [Streptomyces radicis]|nr:hypothetical protein [Streptomyces radicis]
MLWSDLRKTADAPDAPDDEARTALAMLGRVGWVLAVAMVTAATLLLR